MRRAAALALVLASGGCAPGLRFNHSKVILPGHCQKFDVPFYWADGTVTTMHLTGCVAEPEAGK